MPSKKELLLLVIVNILIFVAIEGGFRFFHLGQDTSFLLQEQVGDVEYLRLNPGYAKKYTTRINELVPIPLNTRFRKHKEKDTYRIYVLGESTSQGYPYPKTGAFPFQLEQMLNDAGTDKKFEVINMSMTAIGSHIGLEIAREVVEFPPDLVILYFGHNEFVGIGGAGAWYTWPFQANLALSHSWVYQTLKAQISGLMREDYQTLLEKRSRETKGVPLDSDTYRTTLGQFESNYEEMIQVFRENDIPVVLCGVAKNVQDLPPFMPGESVNQQSLSRIQALLDAPETDDQKDKLIALVGDDAYLSFYVGSHFLETDDIESAKFFLTRANDLDQLRLRASSDINRTIRALAEKHGCPYVDVEKIFETRSPHGIVGNSLMVEHVHPVLEGHSLIAQNLAETIVSRYFEGQPREGFETIPIYLTLVDHIQSARLLFGLFNSFPYEGHQYVNVVGFEPIYDATSEGFITLLSEGDLAQFFERSQEYLREDIDADEYLEIVALYFEFSSPAKVHVNLGAALAGREKYQAAYQEFLVAAQQDRENLHAWNNLGVLHFSFNEFQEALRIFEWLYAQSPEYLDGCKNYWFILDKVGMRDKADAVRDHLKRNGVNVDDIDQVTLYRFSSN